MTVIVCLDNANGMMFNHRRQSRDANVVKDILKTINGASLLIAPYSESLFSQAECSVSISESFLADADAKDYSSPSLCSRMGRSSPLPLIVQYFRLGLEPRV